ncbi:MAG: tRNA guanosine(34) transglycosylase Tgt [Dehalococcoidales bacterium]|nr:tRNA guanosine(34) transglycosylase Tgt [Dehalococcoidales bacterium]
MTKGFLIKNEDEASRARTGLLKTAHGTVNTPVFCPVGSQATVKTLTPDEIAATGAEMILSNTYHLYLRPGIELVKTMRGLHRFMGWQGPILTDSGGFQIFSLSRLAKLTDKGVTFQSHIDGSTHFITPEDAVSFQESLGSDIMMALDDVPAHDSNAARVTESVNRTTAWAKRCLEARTSQTQQLFGIIQGAINPQMRVKSASELALLDFDGYGIGGLSLGEDKETTWKMLDITVPAIPHLKPRYLMGVGSPEDILESVARGIDIFDSVLPTRVARNGGLYTSGGRINIRNAAYKTADRPIESDCDCYTCQNFSAGYLAHLFRSSELLGLRLASIHNVRFLQNLTADIRRHITNGSFCQFKDSFLAGYQAVDEKVRREQKQKWLDSRLGI